MSVKKKSDQISLVSVVMGSKSDWETMQDTCNILDELKIPYETKIVSAHRTPNRLFNFAKKAKSNGINVIIAGAGGAAHLPGMIASLTTLPVLGVPIESKSLKGIDSLLSILQMPAGVPVGTLAIGSAGAKNAALLAASILSNKNPEISKGLVNWRQKQTKSVALSPIDD
jgi:5-(carboxyamino)imidazole ribonucleotide mutase